MPLLYANLELPRCPHCRVDRPNLVLLNKWPTNDHAGRNVRYWGMYFCKTCGGAVIAAAQSDSGEVTEVYPEVHAVEEALPEKARAYLTQAVESQHAPAGAVMLAASAVDAMLKAKGYTEGTLYKRIDKAKADHLITDGMASWAHQVRLDANDQRHADDMAELPSASDARRCIDFASALGQFLFALPARVARGIAEAEAKV